MKKLLLLYCTALSVISLLLFAGFTAPTFQQPTQAQTKQLEGAWQLSDKSGGVRAMMIVQDGFFTVAVYDVQNRKFSGTYGGTIQPTKNKATITYEFNTYDARLVGTTKTTNYSLKQNKLQTSGLGQSTATQNWDHVDEHSTASPLAGTWRITAREVEGQMNTMRPGPRKTLKVLSGTRFQWIAFNAETGEFSGTGGGTYTAKDGKYTEQIEFFSRDSSRVGMALSFNFNMKNGKWHHSGQSSTGKPVNEVWQRISEN